MRPTDRGEIAPHDACDSHAIADLELERLVDALSMHARYRDAVRRTLLALCCDEETIRYRQEILADLSTLPELAEAFSELLPKLVEIGYLGGAHGRAETPLHQTIWRLGELALYGKCVEALERALSRVESSLRSRGLLALLGALRSITSDDAFRALMRRLPEMQTSLSGLRSVTIGINLDHLLRPIEAALLDVSHETFSGSVFLDRLFGRRRPMQGLGPLHSIDTASLPDVREHPFMQPLFRDLDRVIRDAVRPIADFLAGYARVSSQFLLGLEQELAFYVGAIRFAQRLRDQGLPLCRAEWAAPSERVCEIEGLYNVSLALRMGERGAAAEPGQMVLNDVRFGEAGRIFVLTGPNRGGKTTFTQAVGLAHVLHQAGLLVPGRRARLSPVDAILTHFPMAEAFSLDAGRLGDEARRLASIFHRATPDSLILLNESLSSTSPGECLYLAQDVVRALRYLGGRAIYATHLHELAACTEMLNRQTPGQSRIASLVALADDAGPPDESASCPNGLTREARPTFRIEPGPPRGLSYARQIASQYGISFRQLLTSIDARRQAGQTPDRAESA
ncbi:MAG: hypothetical protein JXA74_11475 [Anaerolineae bacterium]|nr:hypothetical protein [Anaerolineae bacterium]